MTDGSQFLSTFLTPFITTDNSLPDPTLTSEERSLEAGPSRDSGAMRFSPPLEAAISVVTLPCLTILETYKKRRLGKECSLPTR